MSEQRNLAEIFMSDKINFTTPVALGVNAQLHMMFVNFKQILLRKESCSESHNSSTAVMLKLVTPMTIRYRLHE